MSDVNLISSLPSPPAVVQAVTQCLFVLLGRRDDLSWAEMREGMRGNSKNIFKAMMRIATDVDTVKSVSIWRRVHAFARADNLHPWLIKHASSEAANICMWLRTLSAYRKMVQVIKRETSIKRIPNFKTPESKTPTPPRRPKLRRRKASPRPVPETMPATEEQIRNYLEVAIPTLEVAAADLSRLSVKCIEEIASYRQPPLVVKRVVRAALLLLGINHKRATWTETKKLIRDSDFFYLLLSCDKDRVPARRIRAFERYVSWHEIQSTNMKHASMAARALCRWAESVAQYSKVSRDVKQQLRKYPAK